jgi:hypothetical protein
MSKEKSRGSDDKKKSKSKSGSAKAATSAVAAPVSVKASKGDVGASVILPCTCSHEWQDKLHGKGQRVFNVGKDARHCTVCGAKK